MGSLLGKALPKGNPVDANIQKTSDHNTIQEDERVYNNYDCGIHRTFTPIFSYNIANSFFIKRIDFPL